MRDHLIALLDAFQDQPQRPATARLQHFVAFHIRYHCDRPEAVFIAYMELRNLTPENFAVIHALRKDYEDRLQIIVEAGRSEGVFTVADSKIATFAIIAMLTGVNTWFRADGRLSLQAVEAEYLRLVERALGVLPQRHAGASQTGATCR